VESDPVAQGALAEFLYVRLKLIIVCVIVKLKEHDADPQ